MEKQSWPTTKQLLLDHLRRIVEGVTESDGEYWFGFGDDLLIPYTDQDEKTREAMKGVIDEAKIWLMLSLLGIRAQDRIGGAEKVEELLGEVFSESFEAPATPSHFIEEIMPECASDEILQRAYAYEMIQKLDDMVSRTRQSLQKRHLLKDVPDTVDDFMAEAAAAFRYGFDRACIAMCRSCLEEALKEQIRTRFGPEYLVIEDQRDGPREASLDALIKCAFDKKKFVPHRFKSPALYVKKWGNDVVHGRVEARELRSISQNALFQTRILVEQLYR